VITAVLDARSSAREQKDFATSDRLRDALTAGGVIVSDTPEGATWTLAGPDS
jgi:cysteinyl-tRNA synthetase